MVPAKQSQTADGARGELPIGVFDSGVGGLTVLRELRRLLPGEDLLYLGDTARVPYGTKSEASVQRYASHAASWLAGRGIKLLVVACNTASALALDALRNMLDPIPVVGVVEPGAVAAVRQSVSQRHLVLATETTASRHAYTRAIQAIRPDAQVEELGCSLFVALAEEGWGDTDIATTIAAKYLAPFNARSAAERPDTAILGCTHFPLVQAAIKQALGPGIAVVDSATTTAAAVQAVLQQHRLGAERVRAGRTYLFVTDSPGRFARIGSTFLGEPCSERDIEVTDIHPLDTAPL